MGNSSFDPDPTNQTGRVYRQTTITSPAMDDTAPTRTTTRISSAPQSAAHYTFDNYQEDAGTTAVYPEAGSGREGSVSYVIFGLVGEAGEIANKWKKVLRDAPTNPAEYYEFYSNVREAIIDELGDTLWYVANLATELGIDLGIVADNNYRKLLDRNQRNVLHGSGDDR